MKAQLKVGDRVRIRGYSCTGIDLDGRKATITDTDDCDGDLTLDVDGMHQGYNVKPSQCVKLVPAKPRLELDGWWVWSNTLMQDRVVFMSNVLNDRAEPDTAMTIREVRRKK